MASIFRRNFISAAVGVGITLGVIPAARANECRLADLLFNLCYQKQSEVRRHPQLEVEARLPNGGLETYVVDPSNGDFVEPMWKAKSLSKKFRFVNDYYANPARETVPLQSPAKE